jgi:hypothetical protein
LTQFSIWSVIILKHGRETIKSYDDVRACQQPQITVEIETPIDVNATDKRWSRRSGYKGHKKEDIKINAYGETVKVKADNPQMK